MFTNHDGHPAEIGHGFGAMFSIRHAIMNNANDIDHVFNLLKSILNENDVRQILVAGIQNLHQTLKNL